MPDRDLTDIIGGVLLVGTGLFFGIYAARYGLGSIGRMGAGSFAMVLGYVLAGLGAGIFIGGLRKRGRMERFEVRPFLAVLAAIVVFTLAVPRVGLVPAAFLLVGIAAIAQREARLLPTLVLAACLSGLTVLIFVLGLGMSMPIVRNPFGWT